ncbi:MAG: hypothetical protein ACJAS9_001949 [Polaribacter sp.]|jgi:hypothetical protein
MSYKHLQSIKVYTGDLEVGMFVSALDKDWENSAFLMQGFALQDQLDIDAVKSDLPAAAVDIAVCHHERLGGQGYPRGLKTAQISNRVRIVSIINAFESLTSDQAHRKAFSVVEAYKVLMQGKGNRFDEHLALKLIEWRGIYPAGTIIEMQNGEVGIVVSGNRKRNKLKPKVPLILDEDKKKRKQRLVDLSFIQTDTESKPYKLFKAYESEAFGVNLSQYLE